MNPRRITDATVEPLSIWQVRDHLRIDDDAFDLPIAGWITAARRQAEHELGRALISQTWELVLPSFPDPLQLPILGVLSVASVKYLPAAGGALATLDPAQYLLDESTPGLLVPVTDWPATAAVPNAVRVQWVAGYGPDADDVPANIKTWMLLQVGSMHRHAASMATGVSVSELPNRFADAMLDPDRVYL